MNSQRRDQLLQFVTQFSSCAVAFSGGVDSAVVAKAAQLALGDRAVAVTGVSPSLASGELEQAKELASLIGIRHVILPTNEFDNSNYLANAPNRCYHCKTELYLKMEGLADKLGVVVILNGTNADDLGDYRPGLQAANEHQVRSPLAECGITKSEVRDLAESWGLPVWDKPASPCLSSRVAYGEQVTPERLRMIDAAEAFFHAEGFKVVRVRFHRDDLARIELPLSELSRFADGAFRERVAIQLRSLGFRFVTLDLEGFRSGNLNSLVSLNPVVSAKSRS